MSRATLIEELSGGVLLITLNRPERKNASFFEKRTADFSTVPPTDRRQ